MRHTCFFFPYQDRPALGVEKKELDVSGSIAAKAGTVVTVLMDGPKDGLAPAFPSGRGLRQIYVDRAGTAVVDLTAEAVATPAGTIEERLRLWALVNTLCYNFSEIKAVKVLVGGDERPSLLGHVDLSRPLLPDDSLVK